MNSRIYFAILFVVLRCNLSYTNAQFRIRNGVNIGIKDSPHSVAIFIDKNYGCVGSLVSMKLVVTVAHCALAVAEQERFVVLAGAADIRDINRRRGQKRKVVHRYYDTNWNLNRAFMDIAVVKVDKPFRKGDAVQSIPLCGATLSPGTMMRISGWGSVTTKVGGVPSYLLQTTELPIVEIGHCSRLYANKQIPEYFSETVLCAGCSGSDVCNGDSGAAAVINGELCAVVQGGCQLLDIPNLLTDITNYRVRDLILDAINRH